MVDLGPIELLRRAAETWPERPALRLEGASTTYAELWEDSGPLRLEPGARAVTLSQGGREALTTYTSIQRAGGVPVELNPTLPDPELIGILRAAEPAGAVADEASRERLGSLWQRAFESPARWLGGEGLEGGGAEAEEPSGLASIVFTSGTTATPKGVELTHANLASVTGAIGESFGLSAEGPREVFLASLPLYYTYGRSLVFLSAALGAELVFSSGVPTPRRLVRLTADEGVTHLSLVPYQALGLLRRPEFCAASLPRLKRISVAGGALSSARLAELRERFPGAVFPMYGLTEAATRLTCLDPREADARPESCGRAIRGVELAIAGPSGVPLAAGESEEVGEVGEVLARGPNLCRGYFRDPAASAALYTQGWLRTGDLGSLDAEGFLTIRGRLKDLIKCMGERVSAKSVEDVSLESDEVVEAAAIGVPDDERGEAVILFVVCSSAFDEAALRARIAERLGRARVPLRVHVREALPKTGSGKVRKALLREPA